MLGTSHTSNETYSTFDRKEETVSSNKTIKKNSESLRPSVLANLADSDDVLPLVAIKTLVNPNFNWLQNEF